MTFPIVDLRHHLEGYLTNEFFKDTYGELPREFHSTSKSFLDSSDAYLIYCDILSDVKNRAKLVNTQKNFESLCFTGLKKLNSKNPLYTELFFSPQLYSINDFTVSDQLLTLINNIKRLKLNIKININFIRELGINSALKYYKQMKNSLDDEIDFWVKGISLGGTEEFLEVKKYLELFRNAHEDGLKTSAIAGIAPNSQKRIWESIFSLQIDRVVYGHQIHLESSLIRHFRATQTPLELSSSFLKSPLFNEDKTDHLYFDYYNSGLNTILVSDFHEIAFNNSEYLSSLKSIGFTDDTLDDILVFNPIRASFLSKFEKGELIDQALNILE
jgi:adenosine deaminase